MLFKKLVKEAIEAGLSKKEKSFKFKNKFIVFSHYRRDAGYTTVFLSGSFVDYARIHIYDNINKVNTFEIETWHLTKRQKSAFRKVFLAMNMKEGF